MRLGAAAFAVLCLPAAAEEPLDPSDAEPVVITGTYLPDPVAPKPLGATLITRTQIEARHASSLVELLREIPGVAVEQTGGRGSVASIFTRGAKPNFTVVLLDGVKINDQTNTRGGSADLSTVSLDFIDRIEIIRGPESAIYGSDAVGGVINIITRKGSERFAGHVEAAGGEFGYRLASTEVSGPLLGAKLHFGGSRTDSGPAVPGSEYRGTAVNGSMSVDLLDHVTATATGRFGSNHAESFPDASGGPELALIRDVDRRNVDETIAGVRIDHRPHPTWIQTLQYGLFSRSSRAVSPGVAPSQQDPEGIPPNADDTSYRRHEIAVHEQIAPWSATNLAFGVDVQHESGTDRGSLQFGPVQLPTSFSLTRTIWAGFLETRLRPLPGLALSGAARYDHADGTPGRFNPKVAVDYTERTTGALLHLSWGRGFKLPSFYGLGNPLVGDPNLKPETSSSVEGGIGRRFSQVATTVEVTGFKTTYRNLIDFNPGPIPRLVNLSAASAHGGELTVTWQSMSRLSVRSYVSYTVSRSLATGNDIRDVPRWLAGIDGLFQPVEPLTLSVRLFHVGSYTDNSVPTGDVQLAGHQRLDFSATWQMLPTSRLYLSVENVLDRQFQEAIGFPSPGRAARGGFVVAL